MKTQLAPFFLHALAVCGVALLAQNAQSQVVYNNTASSIGSFNFDGSTVGNSNEVGNEVILAGEAPLYFITQAAVQFDLVPSKSPPAATPAGGEQVELNFYQNNGGAFFGGGNLRSPPVQESPGTLIWSSGFSDLASLASFTDGAVLTYTPDVAVPQDFTWTLVFQNIPSNESAGLSLCSAVAVGGSDTDAWVNIGTGDDFAWDLVVMTSGNPGLQFEAELWSVPEPQPGVFQSIAQNSNGTVQIGLTGTTGATYTLKVSTNLTAWTPLVTFTNFNGPVEYVDTAASNFPARFYLLTGQPTLQGPPSSTPTLGPPFAPPLFVPIYGLNDTTNVPRGLGP